MMRALSMLIKPASGNCNMRCAYCFYADVASSREIVNRGIMSVDTLEAIVKKALSETTELCVFGFQGGEPTLAGLDFFRCLVDFENKYNVNNCKIVHTIQTNGLTIDEEWAEFLRDNDFLVGLSIDAGKDIHNMNRVDARKTGTHSRCIKAARIMSKAGTQFNILTVVTRSLARHPEQVYRFYKREGFRYIQFIPCLDGLNDERGAQQYSLDAYSYGKFLCHIFDLWYEDFIKGDYTSFRIFDNYIHMLAGRQPENCAMSGRCQAYALIEADGSVYPCDFYALDEFLLGNILSGSFQDILNSDAAKRFTGATAEALPECKECEFFFLCRGGCRRDRETSNSLSRNYWCEGYKAFFSHSLQRMSNIAVGKRGRN